MPEDKCPQCHHEWHRISDHPVYTFEPPGPDDSPYGRATAVKVHIPGGMECLKTRLAQAQARIADLEAALETISKYGDGSICPYGCDTPDIASAALAAKETDE